MILSLGKILNLPNEMSLNTILFIFFLCNIKTLDIVKSRINLELIFETGRAAETYHI